MKYCELVIVGEKKIRLLTFRPFVHIGWERMKIPIAVQVSPVPIYKQKNERNRFFNVYCEIDILLDPYEKSLLGQILMENLL